MDMVVAAGLFRLDSRAGGLAGLAKRLQRGASA